MNNVQNNLYQALNTQLANQLIVVLSSFLWKCCHLEKQRTSQYN